MFDRPLNFAIIGVAGYIAPRHVQAIKETGNRLVCTMDPSDNVGYLDAHFFDCKFFSEFELFEKYVIDLKGTKDQIDYVSICTPDYLHDSHVRFALRNGADAICEKPLVVYPKDLDALKEVEKETGKRVYTILQLRVHPTLIALKEKIEKSKKKGKYDIEMTYITPRGQWFFESWKGQPNKSGGVASTIGIHFFDMLLWIFGKSIKSELHLAGLKKYGGYMELENARVKWFLSVDPADIPGGLREGNQAFRSIKIDGEEIEFSSVFKELHTVVYENTLKGKGSGIDDIRPAVELIDGIRNSKCYVKDKENVHPYSAKYMN